MTALSLIGYQSAPCLCPNCGEDAMVYHKGQPGWDYKGITTCTHCGLKTTVTSPPISLNSIKIVVDDKPEIAENAVGQLIWTFNDCA